MLGVEARSSLPHHQHDGGNLPGQGQPCHFRPDALGQQSGVELLQRTGFARSRDRRALKQILQIVIAVSVQSANGDLFLCLFELPIDTTVIGAAVSASPLRPYFEYNRIESTDEASTGVIQTGSRSRTERRFTAGQGSFARS
jgi:hypothetical protein